MQFFQNRLVFAATDLSSHSECERTTHLEQQVALGAAKRPGVNAVERSMLEKRGHEHEARVLAYFQGLGKQVVSLPSTPLTPVTAGEAASRTEAAMRSGADVIYQGVLLETEWLGRPDFLIKAQGSSRFGAYCYEALDAKLATETRARAILQLCSYTDQLARLQGQMPTHFWIAGGGEAMQPESFKSAEYMALFRRAKLAFQSCTEQDAERAPYPEPVEHCEICRWWQRCADRRREDDHLSLVAGITRRQRDRLTRAGVSRVAELASLPPHERIEGVNPEPLSRVREQARLQVAARTSGRPLFELLLDCEPLAGLESLPEPSPGDVFLDLEGDAFVRGGGLEYLFGLLGFTYDDDPFSGGSFTPEPEYWAAWAEDAAQEKKAFETTIDRILKRRRAFPGAHVYHFGQREPDAIKKLACRHTTREDEVDQLLRGQVFVDLHRVVRQGLRASVESYSLKELERFHGFDRQVELRQAAAAMQWFGWYLETGATPFAELPSLRRDIERYNQDDCLSTARLRDWLEQRRLELGVHRNLQRPASAEEKASEQREQANAEVRRVVSALRALLPSSGEPRTPEERAILLTSHLVDWHWREAKSAWWEYFRVRDLAREERFEDRSALSGLSYTGEVGAQRRSILHRYDFPAQEHAIRPGRADDPDTPVKAGKGTKSCATYEVVEVASQYLVLSRGKGSAPPSLTSLIPTRPIATEAQQRRLLEFGEWVLQNGLNGPGKWRAARDLLLRSPPRAGDESRGACVAADESPIEVLTRLALGLDHSVLAVQGPPGSGKTYSAARMILALIARGQRVGVTANSHKVILGVLNKVIELAGDESLHVLHIGEEDELGADTGAIPFSKEYPAVQKRLRAGELNLVGGTTWAWSRDDFSDALDVLVVDEAGQLSLANVIAASHCARSLVLFGDPAQLEQPQKGVHPEGADASALEHLLGDALTMPPERGIFLPQTRRLHPDLCHFTSEVFYDGRLLSLETTRRQRLDGPGLFTGTGLRFVPVEHFGNSNSSDEEVARIRALVEEALAGGTQFTDAEGQARALTGRDLLVVAPYNAQVTALRKQLPSDVAVGTVDKFQGREAPAVIYSLTSSSAEDAPRGLDFLFNLNRLNVATSRAQALVILVGSPRLTQARCRTPRQMKLVNALCRYLELANAKS